MRETSRVLVISYILLWVVPTWMYALKFIDVLISDLCILLRVLYASMKCF